MKKIIVLATAALLVSGVTFASPDKGKGCCKKSGKSCCKKDKSCSKKKATTAKL